MIKLIAGLFSGFTALIAAIFAIASRKYGVVVAGLAALLALTVLFIGCINALVVSIIGIVQAAEVALVSWLLFGVGLFVPSNFALVLSMIVSGKICRAAYDYGRQKTQIVVYGN